MKLIQRAIVAWGGLLLLWAAPANGQAPESFRAVKKALVEARQKDAATERRKLETTTMFADDFNDGVIDPARWIVDSGLPVEQGGVLSMNATGAEPIITVRMAPSLSAIVEDLVITVDFTSFSSTGQGVAGLFLYTDTFSADLTLDHADGRRAVLYAENDDGSQFVHYQLPTAATTGSLRLVYHHHTGILEGLLLEGGSWSKVGDTVGVSLGSFSSVNIALFASATGSDSVSVSFDNFLAQSRPASPNTAVRKRLWTLYDK